MNGAFKLEIRANDPGSGCTIVADTVQVDYVAVRVSYRTINDGTANGALSGAVCDAADFNFAIDMSGSIGAQGSIPSNLPDLKAGITEFVAAFQNAGGDGRYSGSRFNAGGAATMTSGYQNAATFTAAVNGLTSPEGLTPTQAGINTARGNNANDRAGVANVLFVVTDGSPNVPNTHGDDLTVPETWLQGANGAIGAADAARAGSGAGKYVVKAVYLSTAGDPGDTNLPFSPAGDSQWAQAVMTEIGGGSFLPADFESFVDDLFQAIGCPPPSVVIIKTADAGTVSAGAQIGFTIGVNNQGGRPANDVVVTDNLPGTRRPRLVDQPGRDRLLDQRRRRQRGPDLQLRHAGGRSLEVRPRGERHDARLVRDDQQLGQLHDEQRRQRHGLCPGRRATARTSPSPRRPTPATSRPARRRPSRSPSRTSGPARRPASLSIDNLPAGFTWSLGGPDAASCSINTVPNPDVLSCNFGTLNAGQSRTVTLSAPTASDLCAVIPNTAVVDATNEPNTANYTDNNTDNGSISVHCPGTITIVKDASPADGTDFSFTTSGAGLSNFALDDDGNATLSDTKQFTVPAGAYSVAEVLGAEWDLVSLECSASQGSSAQANVAGASAAITLADGGAVTCTFRNVKAGHIVVQKQTNPNGSAQQFEFDSSWGPNFSLADNGSADSGPLAANASYSVAELVPAGWSLVSAVCNDDDGSNPASIQLDPGEVVTCVFTNTQQARILTDKVTIPAGSQQSFTFDPSWGPDFNLTDGAAANDSGFLAPGQYSLSEDALAGWHITAASCASNQGDPIDAPSAIDLDAGETVTCTFTNEQQGRIIVAKETLPDGAAQPFEFSADWDDSFVLSDGQSEDSGYLDPGTYGVSEDVADGLDADRRVVLRPVESGGHRRLPRARPSPAPSRTPSSAGSSSRSRPRPTARAAASRSAVTSPARSATASTISLSGLLPGKYSTTEADPGDAWDLGAIVCDDGQSATPSSGDLDDSTATFNLDAGETVTCVFTNVQHGTITIIKNADPADGTDFSFDAGNLGSFILDDDEDATRSDTKTFTNVRAGTFGVTEADLDGWDLTSIECNALGEGSSASVEGSTAGITVGDGGSVTCVYTNQAPSIDVVKTAGDAADDDTYITLAGDVTYTLRCHERRPGRPLEHHRDRRQRHSCRQQRRLRGDVPEDGARGRRVDDLLGDGRGPQRSHQHRGRPRPVGRGHPGRGRRRCRCHRARARSRHRQVLERRGRRRRQGSGRDVHDPGLRRRGSRHECGRHRPAADRADVRGRLAVLGSRGHQLHRLARRADAHLDLREPAER